MNHLSRFIIVSSLLAGATTASAQVTTSGINGTISVKGAKETLIGATVKATHLPTGTVYGAVTNAKGNYNISGMRPGGPYRIEVSYIGYDKTVIENVNLSLGESTAFNIALVDGAKSLDQVVIVANSKGAKFNATRTGAASNFSRSAIDRTPTVSRSIFDIAKLTPQASNSGSGTSFGGASNKYNSFQIDGAVSNDVFGLSSSGTNGGQTGATPISLEAIDAVQVVIAPFDVRQSGFTGGGINAITKSGSNEFKGSVYDFFRNQDFTGTTAGKDVKERKKITKMFENSLGFTLGGPIIKNKLFFFANAEYNKEESPTFYGVDNGSQIKKAEADQILNQLEAIRPGYNSGGYNSIQTPTTSSKALVRLDWNINNNNRLTLRYSLLDAQKTIFSNRANQLNFNDRAYDFKNTTHSFVAELNSKLSDVVSNELRFGYTRIRDSRTPAGSAFPSVAIELSGGRSVNLGLDPFAIQNRLQQDIFTLSDNVTLNYGNHVFTLGTHNEFFNMGNLFIRDNYGTYTYGSLEDFLSIGTTNEKLPKQYAYSFSRPDITGTTSWMPFLRAGQLGIFAQDDWKVSDRFKFTYGLRIDIPFFLDKPGENVAFNNTDLAKQYGLENQRMPKSTLLWSPRIGFRYAIDEARNYTLRGGAGIFTGRVPFVWLFNSISNTGIEFSRTELRNANEFNQFSGFKFRDDVNNQYQVSGTPRSEINLASSSFKYPQVLKANLALDASLPWGIKATLEAMVTKDINNLKYVNLAYENANAPIQQGSLQRPTYKKRAGLSAFNDIMYLTNANKGYSYNLTAQLSKDFDFGLGASVAYTFGRSMAVNDGNSSQAYSNWRYNYIFNGGESDELFYSSHDLGHRILATLNYRIAYAKHFATTISLVYNGQSGNRFTVYYRGDLNGDGSRENDLFYVPANDAEITALGLNAQQTADLKEFIALPEIAQYKGDYIPRNGIRSPFTHQIDINLIQDFYLKIAGRKHTFQINASIENFGNMLNRSWGVVESAGYGVSPMVYNNGTYSFSKLADNKMWTVGDLTSRWRAKVGLKYIF